MTVWKRGQKGAGKDRWDGGRIKYSKDGAPTFIIREKHNGQDYYFRLDADDTSLRWGVLRNRLSSTIERSILTNLLGSSTG